MSIIPDKITDFNAYEENNKLVGLTGEVALPSLEAMTSTMSGAGLLGEVESVNIGHFGSVAIELTWKVLYDKTFNLMTYSGKPLILRGAVQYIDGATGKPSFKGIKITIKWMPKGLDLGKLAQNAQSESKNTLEIFYIKVEIDGKEMLELDKFNYVYRVNGQDQLSDIKKLI
ncbi:phage major tail tube protein [Niallia sp. 03190]|uniref:phage major tail tube protein n=1 Tax=Niallia sp. 03190 TaxID=3458061 RepID=UPI004044BBC4